MSEEREAFEAAWKEFQNKALPSSNRIQAHAWFLKGHRAARQSADANETTLRVLPSHAIRKHEGVTIFGDPAQVLKVMAAIEASGATGQEAVACFHTACGAPSICARRGLCQMAAMHAAPIGDNEAETGYAALEREHMGDPDKRTGIYAQRAPVGYKIAPIEPTEEMIDAACELDPVEAIKANNLRKGYKTAFATNGQIFAARYKAAIDAAPIVDNRAELESEQRRKMQERFAQRPHAAATADFDLPAPNDAISATRVKDCESCEDEGLIGSHACPDCAQPAVSNRVELTDQERAAIELAIGDTEKCGHPFTAENIRALLARAQAKGE